MPPLPPRGEIPCLESMGHSRQPLGVKLKVHRIKIFANIVAVRHNKLMIKNSIHRWVYLLCGLRGAVGRAEQSQATYRGRVSVGAAAAIFFQKGYFAPTEIQ